MIKRKTEGREISRPGAGNVRERGNIRAGSVSMEADQELKKQTLGGAIKEKRQRLDLFFAGAKIARRRERRASFEYGRFWRYDRVLRGRI